MKNVDDKENLNGNFRTERYNNQMKISVYELSSKRKKRKNSGELRDQNKLSTMKKKKRKQTKKMKRISGIC